MIQSLSLDILRMAVAGGAAAIRARVRLEPVGGPGDKVFPPSYADDDRQPKKPTKYALEKRRMNGEIHECVLLDSVQSQANRIEEALRAAWDSGTLGFPLVLVDFTATPLSDLGKLSALEAPHRLSDALLRDALLDGRPFRLSPPGLAFTDASVANVSALYKLCPSAIVFGMWDSTGPRGGLGAKFERLLVSEIVGVDAQTGIKTASRIDPAQITKGPVVYEAANPDEGWTNDEALAVLDKNSKAKRVGKDGKPSEINHGNVAPSIDERAGGVTIDHALQFVTLSLAGLRRLGFPTDLDGKPIADNMRADADLAARTVVAALALAGVAHQWERDHHLRSRCDLVAIEPLAFELVKRGSAGVERFVLDGAAANRLFAEACEAARAFGMGLEKRVIALQPAPKLVDLIAKSRQQAAREPEVVK